MFWTRLVCEEDLKLSLIAAPQIIRTMRYENKLNKRRIYAANMAALIQVRLDPSTL